MAQEDSVRTFSKTAGGGGSPYLQGYLGDAQADRSAIFERALQMSREGREQESFDIARQKEARAERRQAEEEARQRILDERRMKLDSWKMQKEQENQERQLRNEELQAARYDMAQKRQDALEAKALKDEAYQTKAAELSSQIYGLDPHRPDYKDVTKALLSDPSNMAVINSKFGKDVLAIKKQQDQLHGNMVEWLQSAAQKSGYSGDIYELPKTKTGDWDVSANGQIFGNKGILTLAQRQKQAQIEASPEYAAKRAQMQTKIVGDARQQLSFLASQRKEIMKEAGELNERQLMQPEHFLDAKGKKTTDPNQAETAVFLDKKGKPKIKLPESQRQDMLTRLIPLIQTEQGLSAGMMQAMPRKLDEKTALGYFKAAGGNPEEARRLAREDGYTF
jgi:hypothetical protein